MLQDDLSIASTPRKLQKSLHSSISRTLGRKLSATLKDPHGLKNDMYVIVSFLEIAVNDSNSIYFRYLFIYLYFFLSHSGPKFDLVATATLSLEEVHDSVKSHDLILENLG